MAQRPETAPPRYLPRLQTIGVAMCGDDNGGGNAVQAFLLRRRCRRAVAATLHAWRGLAAMPPDAALALRVLETLRRDMLARSARCLARPGYTMYEREFFARCNALACLCVHWRRVYWAALHGECSALRDIADIMAALHDCTT